MPGLFESRFSSWPNSGAQTNLQILRISSRQHTFYAEKVHQKTRSPLLAWENRSGELAPFVQFLENPCGSAPSRFNLTIAVSERHCRMSHLKIAGG